MNSEICFKTHIVKDLSLQKCFSNFVYKEKECTFNYTK